MIHYSVAGQVAHLRLNRPPVNALNSAMRSQFLDLLNRANADASVSFILITSDLPVFSGGADIREFQAGQLFDEPGLPDLCETIEQLPETVVIAIKGVAMGGAVELALACDFRVASKESKLGLPEIKLGLMPGAGGTQRLPRLTSLRTAADMILTGEAVSAEDGFTSGLIDELIDHEGSADDFVVSCLEFIHTLVVDGVSKRPGCALLTVNSVGFSEYLEQQKPTLMTSDLMLPARLRALESLNAACQLPLKQGLEQELRGFMDLLETPESQELIKRFFYERESTRDD